ncbi:unnamed protein product [Rotaria socialis]|uniref:Helix-turn-helix domain-containing protein n=1 Tax=Rotaria socialis TaxID=392032 RepID=A0A818NG23_9BILA|nr:unnamed protein product [Rotaria socialis]CAF4792247.1 unnamed protein product [Rotaria socialis]
MENIVKNKIFEVSSSTGVNQIDLNNGQLVYYRELIVNLVQINDQRLKQVEFYKKMQASVHHGVLEKCRNGELYDDANTWHLNIKLDYKIKKSLPFLDVLLTNNNGTLATSVYHKPAAEPYVTPFTSDHPRHVFANIIKTSLERATRYSSTFQEFNNERRIIKLMLLYNEHRLTFIENEFKKKFPEYISISPFLHFIDDENKYIHRRQK